MKAIVCVDKKWGIGRGNDLLFNIPDDMAFFRKTTLGKVVVMGKNTLKSFPNGNPLKNRTNIVLSTQMEEREDCKVVRDLQGLKQALKEYNTQDVMVIGGGSIYKTMLPFCDEILVTKANADGNADTFFPDLDSLNNFEMVYQSEKIISNGIEIVFTTYKNNNVIEL